MGQLACIVQLTCAMPTKVRTSTFALPICTLPSHTAAAEGHQSLFAWLLMASFDRLSYVRICIYYHPHSVLLESSMKP